MFKEIINKLKDKNIAILGFGREGKATYNFIRRHLKEKQLTIIDKSEIVISDSYTNVITGDNYLENLEKYDLIIKSPGISLKDIDYSHFEDKITSELELILEVFSKNIIGITGTKGKSTTSSLMYQVLKDQGYDVYLLGNIGNPIFDALEDFKSDTILVIEMSSHQLEFIHKSPHIATILNLYQDHLDHAGSLEHYHNNKMNIFKYQVATDYSLYFDDDSYLSEKMDSLNSPSIKYNIRFDAEKESSNAVRIKNKKIYLNNKLLYEDKKRKLQGDHNLKNIMFIVAIAHILNLDLEKAAETISNFKGLKYRMEYIGKYAGVFYYNDTIATIPAATINAIKTIGNVNTLIFGGMDRKIDYQDFIEFLVESNIENLICMPSTGTTIGKTLEKKTTKNIYYAPTLEEAHSIAVKVTKMGTSCLLSPAASSYEYFKNFEEKGQRFEELVKKGI